MLDALDAEDTATASNAIGGHVVENDLHDYDGDDGVDSSGAGHDFLMEV